MNPVMNNEQFLDAFVLSEPLACVMHAYRRLPATLEIHTITIFGGGPIGVLHALHLRTLYPFSLIQIIEPDARRRKIINNKFPFILLYETPDRIRQSDLAVVATSAPEAQVNAIKTAAAAAIVILFSGINHKSEKDLPVFEGENLEAIHRKEEIRVISKNVRLVGSSGYHPKEIDASILSLRKNPSYYCIVQTGIVEGLGSYLINNQRLKQPAIVKLLTDSDFGQTFLKVLFRHSYNPHDETKVIYEDGSVKLQNYTAEVPGNNQVGLRVLRSSICQTDRRVLLGMKRHTLHNGIVLGHEGIGVIVSVGKNVSEKLIGKACSIMPHYFSDDDAQEQMGMGYLSSSMKHLGIHVDGCFTTLSILPISCIRIINNFTLAAPIDAPTSVHF